MKSKMLVLVAVCLCFGLSRPEAAIALHNTGEGAGKIVGGIRAEIEDYPYQISLQYRGRHTCGGSILGPKTIVTAAHCTDGVNTSDMSIRAGSIYHKEGGIVVGVEQIFQHSLYDAQVIDYDISVLILKEVLNFTHQIQPINVSATEIGPNHFAVVSGWGTLKENGNLPEHLQQVYVPILNTEDCKNFYEKQNSRITERMICAGYTDGGHDSCQGDSGGPLVYKEQLIGIVSWGIGCARPNYPGVYTSIPKVRSYIQKYL